MIRRLSEKLQQLSSGGVDFHFRELLKGSSAALFLKIGSALVIYLFQFFIAKIYGPAGNGLFSYCFAVLNILIIVSIFGLETYLVRLIADFASRNQWHAINDSYKKAIGITLTFSLILTIGTYFGMPYLMKLAGKADYQTGLKITALALAPATILRLNSEALKGLKEITHYSLLQNISILACALIGMMTLELFHHQQANILWGLLFGELVMMGFSFRIWKKKTVEPLQLNPEETLSTKHLIKTSLPFVLTSTTFFLMNWTDKIMLGFMASQAELGIYEIALKIASLATLIKFAINTIAGPKFSEFYWNNNWEQFRKFAHQTTFATMFLTIPIVAGIVLLSELLLGIFGKEFLSGEISLYLLTAGCLINACVGSVIVILNMTGKQKTALFTFSTVGLFNVIANYFLIPVYGINGAAFATMVSMMLWNITGMILIYKYYGFWTLDFYSLLKPSN